jgi:SWI/SNF-related matrix-associated actin-dependent regulator of chromatin subfamily A-like protein 1
MNLKPYQIEAINFALKRRDTLIADEMGLGKTISAIGVYNALPAAHPTMLVVCPANLVLNWTAEIEKWSTRLVFVSPIMAGGKPVRLLENVWVISYELLGKWREQIHSKIWDLVVYDESHYMKNPRAIRTKAAFQISAKKRIFLTGTPILSRPLDLWTTYDACLPGGNWYSFVRRYCNAHHKIVYTKRGQKKVLDVSGASHLDELHDRIKPFMIRRLKKDVLEELPEKTRQKIVLPSAKFKKEIKEERRVYEAYPAGRIYTASKVGEVIAEKESARVAVAKAKLPYVIEHIRNILEQEAKVIVFYYHHAIGDLLAEEFKDMNPALINGNVAAAERQAHLLRFQTQPDCRVLLGSVPTAVGYSATAGRVVVFVELDWVPGNLHQAEDRPHRIGQENNVLIQYLVLEDSVDDDIVTRLTEKTEIVQQVL